MAVWTLTLFKGDEQQHLEDNFTLLFMLVIKVGRIGLLSICFGPNQILEFCLLKLIESTQKEVIQIVKRHEFKQSKTNTST